MSSVHHSQHVPSRPSALQPMQIPLEAREGKKRKNGSREKSKRENASSIKPTLAILEILG